MRCVRWRQGPSHVTADGPIRKLDFILNTLGSPLGNLKQGSDIDSFFFLFFFLASLCGMWHLSSPTRDQTHILCIRSEES